MYMGSFYWCVALGHFFGGIAAGLQALGDKKTEDFSGGRAGNFHVYPVIH